MRVDRDVAGEGEADGAGGEPLVAEDVAGLRTFLADQFTAPPLTTGLAVNPTPVKSTGTVSFVLAQSATVTVISTGARAYVRTNGSAASSAGSSAATS